MPSTKKLFENVLTKLERHRDKGLGLGVLGPAVFVEMASFLKDFEFAPAKVFRPATRRVLTFGDVHGDFLAFLCFLYTGGCIDKACNWIGGDTHVVQVGDFLDQGGRSDLRGRLIVPRCTNIREEIDIMQFAYFLGEAAKEVGGSVTLLSGNHELANFNHDFQCTTKATNAGWGGLSGRRRWFQIGNALALYFATCHPVMVVIGRLVFVHGGIGPPCRENVSFKEYVNLVNSGWTEYLRGTASLPRCVYDALFTRSVSDQFEGSEEECGRVAHDIFARVGFPSRGVLVVGHTPQIAGYQAVAGVNGVCHNSVWRVDVAASKGFEENDRIQCLEISDDERYQVLASVKKP